ncbi:hypothetical protein PRBEI_2000734000 [Prionailurus iriomotensis]
MGKAPGGNLSSAISRMESLPCQNRSMEIPVNIRQREDISHTDKPVVGDEFLAQFLQNYEMEDDIKMLLEMPANGEKEMTGKEDVCQAASRELAFFEVSDWKLDDQEAEKTSLVPERDQDGMWESRTEKKLRKTRHHGRKKVISHHKKRRQFLKMLYETMEEVKSCEELVSNMLHALK